MARRKNTKRIDPRYFLNETVNRGEEATQAAMRELLQKALEIHEYTAPLSYDGIGHAVVTKSGSLNHDQPDFGDNALDGEDLAGWEKLEKEFDNLHTKIYGEYDDGDLRYIAKALAAAGAYK